MNHLTPPSAADQIFLTRPGRPIWRLAVWRLAVWRLSVWRLSAASIGLLLAAGIAITPTTPARSDPGGASVTSRSVEVKPSPERISVRLEPQTVDSKTKDKSDAAPGPGAGGAASNLELVASVELNQTSSFSTVGATWRADADQTPPTVQIQTKLAGNWSNWSTISQSEPLKAADGKLATPAVYVGPSTAIKLRLLGPASTTPREIQLALLDSQVSSSDRQVGAQQQLAAADNTNDRASKPNVIPRSQWGANESWKNCTPDIDPTIQAVAIHHTAGSNSYTAAESPAILRSIYSYHTRTLGWCDIGYNFLVDKFGKIYEGRAGGQEIPLRGSHAASWNYTTTGVSFMGNFDQVLPPQAMLESGARISAWKLDGYQRLAKGTVNIKNKNINIIFGHGDVMNTDCPGDHVVAKMNWLRDRISSLLGARSPVYGAWTARGGEKGKLGSPSNMEKIVSPGRYAEFSGGDLALHPTYGTRVVEGAIRARYRTLGATNSRLGWPTSDEQPGPFNSRVSRFRGGDVYWTSKIGARELWGRFKENYPANMQYIGLPTSFEYQSRRTPGLVMQDYQTGRQYWTSRTNGWALYGGNLASYKKIGEETSPLGLPTSNEYGASGGRVNNFVRGGIYYTDQTGSRAVYGPVDTRYRQLGGPGGRLGFPTTDEHDAPQGRNYGRKYEFQGGTLTWIRSTGQVQVRYNT